MQPAGQHSWWRSFYNRLSQAAPEAEDDANEMCTPQKSSRSHPYQHRSRTDVQVRDTDNIAHYPPKIIFDSSIGKPHGSAGARGQKDLGATEPALPFVYNEISNSVQLSNSYKEPQINFAANTHRDFHLARPNLAAINIPTRYQTGSSEPTSPIRLQSQLSSSEPPTEDGRPFSSDTQRSNHRRDAAAIPRGYRDEAFVVSPYHSPSCYPSSAADTRFPTKPLAGSTDPWPFHAFQATRTVGISTYKS